MSDQTLAPQIKCICGHARADHSHDLFGWGCDYPCRCNLYQTLDKALERFEELIDEVILVFGRMGKKIMRSDPTWDQLVTLLSPDELLVFSAFHQWALRHPIKRDRDALLEDSVT